MRKIFTTKTPKGKRAKYILNGWDYASYKAHYQIGFDIALEVIPQAKQVWPLTQFFHPWFKKNKEICEFLPMFIIQLFDYELTVLCTCFKYILVLIFAG